MTYGMTEHGVEPAGSQEQHKETTQNHFTTSYFCILFFSLSVPVHILPLSHFNCLSLSNTLSFIICLSISSLPLTFSSLTVNYLLEVT